MKRILLTIEYNGKNTCGWQMQAGGASLPARRKIPFHGILAGLEGTTVVHFALAKFGNVFPLSKGFAF